MAIRRAASYSIDWLLSYTLISIVYYSSDWDRALAVNGFILYIYFTVWLLLPGKATIGKRIIGLRVYQSERSKGTAWRLLLREAPFPLLMLVPYALPSALPLEIRAGSILSLMSVATILLILEVILILSDSSEYRGLRDRIAGTSVSLVGK